MKGKVAVVTGSAHGIIDLLDNPYFKGDCRVRF